MINDVHERVIPVLEQILDTGVFLRVLVRCLNVPDIFTSAQHDSYVLYLLALFGGEIIA